MRLKADAILFDLDGVLVDSSQCMADAWFQWAEGVGLDAAATFALGHGRATVDHVRLAAPHLDAEAAAREIDELEVLYLPKVRLQPGALEATEALAQTDALWGVVTACTAPAALARLDAVGIAAPPVLVATDEVQRCKPAPDGYLLGCERLGVAPERVLVFEDAPVGVTAARAAGTQVVALRTTHEADELPVTDAAVRDLSGVRLRPGPGHITIELI